MDFNIEEVVENIRVVDQERDYWFFRTYSGHLFDEFYERNYIGLGLNEIPYQYIKEASKADEATFTRLRTSIESKYNFPASEVTRWANQLIDFEKGVKVGDMVISPSGGSEKYAFGIVESKTFVEKDSRVFQFRDRFEPYPEKRKHIKWLKIIDSEDLNGDLKALSSTRMPLTNAFTYREAIEGNLSTVYIKEGRMYLTIQINQDDDINAFAFAEFLSGLTYFYKEFCKENGDEDNEDLFLKIKVQSRGKMFLKALAITGGIGLAGLIIMSSNHEVKVKLLKDIVEVEGKSTGFLESYTKFLDASQERQFRQERFEDSMARLKAQPLQNSVTPKEDEFSDPQSTEGAGKTDPHHAKKGTKQKDVQKPTKTASKLKKE
ncbi:hypothetical protein [Mucilaginibacter sp. CSA2-8R]|uniref:hypothetical protein n=1 Tax=Mucilaginibacter sp. CSA2-8R TaxID=3141542 RepID=UPI00315CBED6